MCLYRAKHTKVKPTWGLSCRPPRASQPPSRSDFGNSGPFLLYIYIYIYIQYMYLYRAKHPKVNPTWCLTCRPPRASQSPIRLKVDW